MDYEFVSEFEPARVRLIRLNQQFELALSRKCAANLCEVAILLQRGGRRVPTWLLRDFNSRILTDAGDRSFDQLRNEQLFDLREATRLKLIADKVVPKTKSRLFASFIATTVCATPEGLSHQAGISIKTARVWLKKAGKFEILQAFVSRHEAFYLNFELMQLLAEGHTAGGVFRHARFVELQELRRRRDWLEDSRIAAKFPDYRR